ncbi:MAG: dTMP kinase [bacterium]
MSDKQKGYFITFEGADGSGKTTQISKLSNYLTNNNTKNIQTRDPGGTELGSSLRQILLHYPNYISPNCELFLYLADRSQHVDEKILPALKEGNIVLCDRFIDSSLAYQGYGRGIDLNQIIELNKIATRGLIPDLTILLDIDTDTAANRIAREKDRFESEAQEFHKKVRQGYLEVAKSDPSRFVIINANQSIEDIFTQLISVLKEKQVI